MRIVMVLCLGLLLQALFINCSNSKIPSRVKVKKIVENPLITDLSDSESAEQISHWENQAFDEYQADGSEVDRYPEYFLTASFNEVGEVVQFEKTELSAEVLANTFKSLKVKIDARRLCSDARTRRQGVNLFLTDGIQLNLKDPDTGETICESNDYKVLKEQLFKKGTFELPNCNLEAADKKYELSLKAKNGKTLLFKRGTAVDSMVLDFAYLEEKGELLNDTVIRILVDKNKKREGPKGICDDSWSPLAIDFRQDVSRQFSLTSPENGVLFDIMGIQAQPAYTPVQISWFTDSNVGLLVLPDHSGRVKGIDQLFGDNTLGPDNKTARNGFHALQKYDGLAAHTRGYSYSANGNLLIDENDGIFDYLKVWFDRNLDGITQYGEMRSLSDLGIKYIDLRYDPRFVERDQFGNEIRYKSVVGMADGSIRLIFDVFFFNATD